MDRDSKSRGLACFAGVLIASALVLSGCSSTIADMPSLTSNDAPARPKEPSAFLPVNDTLPQRGDPTMSADERSKIQKELLAARDRQASAAGK